MTSDERSTPDVTLVELDEITALKAENARLRQALYELDPEWESRDDEVIGSLSSECRIPREYLIRR